LGRGRRTRQEEEGHSQIYGFKNCCVGIIFIDMEEAHRMIFAPNS
jgi:hypothetical protein